MNDQTRLAIRQVLADMRAGLISARFGIPALGVATLDDDAWALVLAEGPWNRPAG